MAEKLRVGLLTAHNPYDRKAFSGTPYFLMRAMQQEPGFDLRVLGGHRPPGLLDNLPFGPRRPRGVTPADIDENGLDWIVGVVSGGLLEGLRTPFVHVTDATPNFIREFYEREIPPETDAAEARVLRAATRTVYSSQYMADRAVLEYGSDVVGRPSVIPFGLNLDRLPAPPGPKPPLSPLRLLYIGKSWKWKGGVTSLETQALLRARGIDARLSLVGGIPESVRGMPGVDAVGYLDKNRPRDYCRFVQLLEESHVFILPTLADCTPMVIAEANAYGVPVLISELAGIPSLMAPGRNGAMLPPKAGGAAYADRIVEMTADPEAYAALSRSSYEHCRDRLTWSAWTRDLLNLLHAAERPVPIAAS